MTLNLQLNAEIKTIRMAEDARSVEVNEINTR